MMLPPVAELVALAEARGFKAMRQTMYTMVWLPRHLEEGRKKPRYRLYIANGLRGCTAIHLSGFGEGMPGTIAPPKHNGNVQAHLDLGHEHALENFLAVLERLKAL